MLGFAFSGTESGHLRFSETDDVSQTDKRWPTGHKKLCSMILHEIRVTTKMKLLFSEQNSDYENYQFPYAVWAFPETGETPAEHFQRRFPAVVAQSGPVLSVPAGAREPCEVQSRRPRTAGILRKGAGIDVKLVPRDKFDYTAGTPPVFQDLRRHQFGKDVMTFERLDATVRLAHHLAPACVHGFVKRKKKSASRQFIWKASRSRFTTTRLYDLNYYARNLGMFMMTSAVALFAERSCKESLPRHVLFGQRALQDAVRRRGIFQTASAGRTIWTN